MNEAELTQDERISATLSEMGFSFESKVLDAGGHGEESKFSFTITKGNASHSGTFTKGSAHRILITARRRPLVKHHDIAARITKALKGAKSSSSYLFHSERPTIAFVETFNAITEPSPLTLSELVWSLWADCSGVRYGETFEDWAPDYGYDSDSLKALKIFEACQEIWRFFRRAGIGDVEGETLDALFKDY